MTPYKQNPSPQPVSHRAGAVLAAAVTALMAICPVLAQAPPPDANTPDVPARPETGQLSPEQQRDYDLLMSVVRDAEIDLGRRRSAAASLLSRDWPTAVDELAALLRESDHPGTHRAIAGAVAELDDPPPGLVDPLLQLVGNEPTDLQRDVADALSQYDDSGVVDSLVDMATDPNESTDRRRGAIAALAEHRKSRVVETLLELTGPRHDRVIRSAAFDALGDLTGNTALGQDRRAWQQWWAEYRDLPRERWLARLVRSLSQANKRLNAEQSELVRRLVETYNRLYVATPESERPALLLSMLDDPVVGIRLLATQLIERKVLNAQAVDAKVRLHLREAMTDPSPRVRAEVAALLRDMDDAPAAKTATERLLAEPEPEVQNAYLSLLARKPQPGAIDPALMLLGREPTRAAAATFLEAAHQAELLDTSQLTRARKTTREQIDPNDDVEPALVRLLASLKPSKDADLLQGLLTHSQEEVRRAAAEAYVQGRLPIDPLLDRLKDSAVMSKAFEAATRHGDKLAHATALVELGQPPDDSMAEQAWRAAIVAVAGRLGGQDLLALDEAMTGSAVADLRPDVLEHAIDLPDDASAKPALLARLAEQAAAHGRAELLQQAMRQLAAGNGAGTQQQARRIAQWKVRANLLNGEVAEALTQAQQALEADPNFAPELGQWLVEAAEAAAENDDAELAQRLMAKARQLVGDALSPDCEKRLADLEKALAQRKEQG